MVDGNTTAVKNAPSQRSKSFMGWTIEIAWSKACTPWETVALCVSNKVVQRNKHGPNERCQRELREDVFFKNNYVCVLEKPCSEGAVDNGGELQH